MLNIFVSGSNPRYLILINQNLMFCIRIKYSPYSQIIEIIIMRIEDLDGWMIEDRIHSQSENGKKKKG